MANVPFPIQGDTLDEVRYQIYELIRTLFEEKIGGEIGRASCRERVLS